MIVTAGRDVISENVIDQGLTMGSDSRGSRNEWEKRVRKLHVDKIICD